MSRKIRNDELDRLTEDQFIKSAKTPLVIVLDNVRSLNNVGSVFRTADCYRVEKVLLCGITATPPHREIRKTALGASETVSWEYYEHTVDAIEHLKKKGYLTCAVEQAEESSSLNDFKLSSGEKIAVVLGNEVKGVDQKVVSACDKIIELKQYGTKHSLNISVCTGIVIYDLFHKISALN